VNDSPSHESTIYAVPLSAEELVRVNALAACRNVMPDQMVHSLVQIGLLRCERKARLARAPTKRMAARVVDRVFLVLHGVAEPTDDEWGAFMDVIEHHGLARTSMLVFTVGPGPSAAQVRHLDALLAGRVPIAVISSHRRVRMRAAPLSSRTRPRVKMFATSHLGDALLYLDVTAIQRELIEREVVSLLRGGLVGAPDTEPLARESNVYVFTKGDSRQPLE
jgi:hypothetical protein